MPILNIPESLQIYANVPSRITIQAGSISELRDGIEKKYPSLYQAIFNAAGNLTGFAQFFLKEKLMCLDQDVALTDQDEIELVTSLSGG